MWSTNVNLFGQVCLSSSLQPVVTLASHPVIISWCCLQSCSDVGHYYLFSFVSQMYAIFVKIVKMHPFQLPVGICHQHLAVPGYFGNHLIHFGDVLCLGFPPSCRSHQDDLCRRSVFQVIKKSCQVIHYCRTVELSYFRVCIVTPNPDCNVRLSVHFSLSFLLPCLSYCRS